MEPMETSMEKTSRATATGSRPSGTRLLRASVMARMPTISSAVPITCGAGRQLSATGASAPAGGHGAGTHLVQEAVGEGEVLGGVCGEDGGGLQGAGGGEGPVAVELDGVCGAEPAHVCR